MALDIILNELSLAPPAPDQLTARQCMFNFIQTVRGINSQTKSQSILRSQYDFYSTVLASNYSLRQWLNDHGVVREERQFIRSLATKAPFSEDIRDSDEIYSIENNSGVCEFRYQGKPAIGLSIAYMLNTIAISLLSEACWDYSYLDLDVVSLEDDDKKITVIHTSCKKHLQDHVEWIKIRLNSNIDGRVRPLYDTIRRQQESHTD